MKHDELTSLRYHWASVENSMNTGDSMRAIARTVNALLAHIRFQEEEIDRVQAKLNERTADEGKSDG